MSREVLKDLNQSAQAYRSNLGLPLTAVISFDVPVSYAKIIKASMEELGVDMPEDVEPGSVMQLEFRDHHQVALCVQGDH